MAGPYDCHAGAGGRIETLAIHRHRVDHFVDLAAGADVKLNQTAEIR
jgi:hypothetical protein